MALHCGIIGTANVGKTTLFNCMSKTKAESSNYAFTSNKSNIGIIDVPDERLYKIADLLNPAKITPATVNIVDIPGLAKGSSRGEGIGNTFLADIRNTDALIHVLRCFDDDNLSHIDGSVDPVRDKENIDMELQIKDLESVEKKLQQVEKLAKSGDKEARKTAEVLSAYKDHLESFQPARTAPVKPQDHKYIEDMFLLSDKPVFYVCNVDEAGAINGNAYVEQVKEAIKDEHAVLLTVAAQLESEIAELDDPADRMEFLKETGLREPSVNKIIRTAYEMLNLMAFFTAGEKEVRAWTIRKNTKAPQAAGTIHSDMEKGFIRAEVIKYDDYMSLGTEQACKDAGKMRLEGKEYIVQDGDIMIIRFNV
jgi:ribosome-binding ATPase